MITVTSGKNCALNKIADFAIFLIVSQSRSYYMETGSEHQPGPFLLSALQSGCPFGKHQFSRRGPSRTHSILKMQPQLVFTQCVCETKCERTTRGRKGSRKDRKLGDLGKSFPLKRTTGIRFAFPSACQTQTSM